MLDTKTWLDHFQYEVESDLMTLNEARVVLGTVEDIQQQLFSNYGKAMPGVPVVDVVTAYLDIVSALHDVKVEAADVVSAALPPLGGPTSS
jgi:hypothetical protein